MKQIFLEGKSTTLNVDWLLIMENAIEYGNISPRLIENKNFTVLITV